jgi:tetratricopeptide (TPR) repeat protein
MKTVFISYRQTSDAERDRVREFGERLRGCGITVVLDQFLLDEKPEGSGDGWDKWSSDRALETECVIIIGNEAWFQCFDKTQKPGTGLGAANEADDIRHRITKAGGIVEDIRVVLFDDADAKHISAKLERYRRFHAGRDFAAIVKWLGGTVPAGSGGGGGDSKTSIPHNLPTLQPFFGREDELRKIADALDPDSRTWGALIDGPGGMGKTSLAVRAAYDASPDVFKKIIFVSLKTRELDDDGVRDLSGFILSGLVELLNELARELGCDDIAKAPEDQRPRLLLDKLRGTQTLLVLDNLESLLKRDRDTLFTFVKKLPAGCKAILTSRGRIGSGAEELILEAFSEEAALATLAELATHNPLLAQTSEAERLVLYRETAGKPLLLRWTAGQLGRGHCLTFTDALHFIRSCPEGNDPLEFIFGDLVGDFDIAETAALCALTYFTLPANVEHIATLAGLSETDTDRALRKLTVRSLVVPTEELKTFTLVPMVADFLRKKKPEVVAETGDRLEKRAYALIVENGYDKSDRFPVLDTTWPTLAPALPLFAAGTNPRLQTVCEGLKFFLEFYGRWDESLWISWKAEERAVAALDFGSAGWRANDAGWVHYLRGQADTVLECADRADAHWNKTEVKASERAVVLRLRGNGHRLAKNYASAIESYRKAREGWATIGRDHVEIALILDALADTERQTGCLSAAAGHYGEALRIAYEVNDKFSITAFKGKLAEVELDLGKFREARVLAKDALAESERLGRLELIAENCHRLAKAFLRDRIASESLPHARRAVDIFTRLGSPDLADAQATLAECERALAGK